MRIEAFIIHLERAIERKGNVAQLQQEIARLTRLEVHIVSAVDGKNLSQADITSVYNRRLYQPYYPFDLSNGEVACFLSHRKCWQEIVDRKLDAALIVEDDVQPTLHFPETYALVSSRMEPGDYIRMAKDTSETSYLAIGQSGSVRMFMPKATGLGMLAQIVTHDAAVALLAATRQFDRPVDTFLQLNWRTGLRPVTCIPPAFSEQSMGLGGTTIQSKRNWRQKLRAEFLRPLFRLRMKRSSKKHILMPRGVSAVSAG